MDDIRIINGKKYRVYIIGNTFLWKYVLPAFELLELKFPNQSAYRIKQIHALVPQIGGEAHLRGILGSYALFNPDLIERNGKGLFWRTDKGKNWPWPNRIYHGERVYDNDEEFSDDEIEEEALSDDVETIDPIVCGHETTYMPKVYTASKLHHHAMWKEYREKYNDKIEFTARWLEFGHEPDHNVTGVWTNEQKRMHWIYNMQDVDRADFVICYRQGDDRLSGTIFECGAAVAAGKIVLAVGMTERDSWQEHPLVFKMPDIKSAFDFILG